ncbi:MAG: LacI family DNA-binding transcriptional regulator, partial [Spirochaetota bacterium]|nr:LacI family DNA-binding transcriptional regulator [Spirochaetota bacterium]
EKTKQRILSVMEEMDFFPNPLARGLNLKRTNTIALIIPDIQNPLYTEIARGVESIAHRNGNNLLLCNTEKDVEKEKSYVRMLIEKKIDGVILAYTSLKDCDFKDITDRDINLLLCGMNVDNEQISSVYSDFREGAKLAIEHLINLGYRRIACVTGSDRYIENREKVTGYLEKMRTANLPIYPHYLIHGDDDINSGYLSALKVQKLDPKPEALFICNDLMAIGAIHSLQKAGIRVPDEMSVIGYDNIVMGSFIDPKLTTISWPVYKMGVIAARILLDEINTEPGKVRVQRVLLKPKLKIRQSCGHGDRVSEIFN